MPWRAISAGRLQARDAVRRPGDSFATSKPFRNTYGTDIGPVTGQDFYKALSYNMTGKPGAAQSSQAMQAGGIPGIKYLDEGSRNLSDKIAFLQHRIDTAATPVAESIYRGQIQKLQGRSPTSNYVVFDPSTIDILKKYGVVGAPAGALGMGALADQSQYEVQP